MRADRVMMRSSAGIASELHAGRSDAMKVGWLWSLRARERMSSASVKAVPGWWARSRWKGATSATRSAGAVLTNEMMLFG